MWFFVALVLCMWVCCVCWFVCVLSWWVFVVFFVGLLCFAISLCLWLLDYAIAGLWQIFFDSGCGFVV